MSSIRGEILDIRQVRRCPLSRLLFSGLDRQELKRIRPEMSGHKLGVRGGVPKIRCTSAGFVYKGL